ncbi:MAG: hypothetical protein KBH41_19640, partial [Azonexus sp.]|nr:hypothetical protein [Azonexus sp.]
MGPNFVHLSTPNSAAILCRQISTDLRSRQHSKELMGRLPEIVPNALVQTGYGESRKPARSLPDDWPKGFQLVWPLRVQGMALILR